MGRINQEKSGVLIVQLLGLIFTFLLALQLLILAFDLLGQRYVEQIIVATSNPFINLFIGLLATAIIQSSSTITSLTVVAVAANTLSLESAVFIVMGANIGTTVTSTLASVSHVSQRKEFRKAIAAATLHDFFNIFTTLILFPLEYYFGVLSSLARTLSAAIQGGAPGDHHHIPNPLGRLFTPITQSINSFLGNNSFITLITGSVLLFVAIRTISYLLKPKWEKQTSKVLEQSLFGHPFKALLSGTVITGIMQSSSVVSTLIVPMVATNKLSLRRVFPFIMGANLGTTFTALVAAFSKSETALSIAFTHILFNIIGVLLFFPATPLRNLPLWFARRLGNATLSNRLYGFAYIILTFFIIPFFLIFFSQKSAIKQNTSSKTPSIIKAKEVQKNKGSQ
ncbi:Na/Pi symporter [uncultured Microscilla sp.]|uniref:Na/Pi symporter n=1 Tax=uncultured Microscilla sp. TaxID=432653 RepID=UPI002604AF43|nr:Na/Pi symporter [uncultured Microscilla sp.]